VAKVNWQKRQEGLQVGEQQRRGRVNWAAAYGKYIESGLSQARYCEREGLNIGGFQTGTKAARKAGLIGQGGADRRAKGECQFMAVKIRDDGVVGGALPEAAYCEIRFNGKAGIRIETAEAMGALASMMRQLIHGITS
jgi:hypothetical protein